MANRYVETNRCKKKSGLQQDNPMFPNDQCNGFAGLEFCAHESLRKESQEYYSDRKTPRTRRYDMDTPYLSGLLQVVPLLRFLECLWTISLTIIVRLGRLPFGFIDIHR